MTDVAAPPKPGEEEELGEVVLMGPKKPKKVAKKKEEAQAPDASKPAEGKKTEDKDYEYKEVPSTTASLSC